MSALASAPLKIAPLPPVGPQLRVCLVTEASGGGVGRHFLDLAAGLAARGVDVVAIYSPHRSDILFQERKSGVRGVRFIELPMRRAVRPGDLLDLGRLIATIRRHGPFDVIHGHSSKAGALARLAGRILQTSTVYTPHAFVTLDPGLSPVKRTVFAAAERWLARCSDRLIAVSPDEAEHARSLGIAPARVSIVPNGVGPVHAPPRDDVRRKLGLTPDDVAIGFVGRLVPQKSPDVLLEAFALVAQRVAAARLVLVGSGPLANQLHRRSEQLQLAERVQMLGDRVATDYLPALDVFCLSSRYEGMTYVMLEALAAGLPIVATRVGGVSLCVEDGVNGCIVPVNDLQAIAQALRLLVSDCGLRQRYAAASRSRGERFTVDRMVDETLRLYAATFAQASQA